jgi:hypothetical protein
MSSRSNQLQRAGWPPHGADIDGNAALANAKRRRLEDWFMNSDREMTKMLAWLETLMARKAA